MVEVVRYTPERYTAWNEFVRLSKQGTFLLCRDYMDHHRNRFSDHSLMIYSEGKLSALLPGHEQGCVWSSHAGLTYGGLLTTTKTTAMAVCDMFRHVNKYLYAHGFHTVVYKPIPWIYHQIPAEEDLYAIFNVCQARLMARNIASVVIQERSPKWRPTRLHGASKAADSGVIVERSEADLPVFWEVLTQNLHAVHHASPVHTIEEITRLQTMFPDNICLYVAKLDGMILGGTLLFVTSQVVHVQYISASSEGKRRHVLDMLFRKLLTDDFAHATYFDFGTSNEDDGRVLNKGLIFQKEGFGARGVCYDRYEWSITADV